MHKSSLRRFLAFDVSFLTLCPSHTNRTSVIKVANLNELIELWEQVDELLKVLIGRP